MVRTILLFAGTTPGAVGMDFLRRISASQNLTIQTVALDVDGTHVYPCNLPLHNLVAEWPPGDFLHCPMPDSDLLQSIESGRHPGRYENVNLRAIRALKAGVHASGGTRPNGSICFEVNREVIAQKLRQCFRRTLLEQSAKTTTPNETVRVILVASTFGGFASGSLEPLKQLVWEIAEDMKVAINFSCILLIPGGTNTSKDSSNSRAVTAAVMKELVAISSGQHWHRQRLPGQERLQSVLSRHTETILVSDTNYAKEAQGLAVPDLVSMVAEVILTLVATPLGARLTTQAADFVMRATDVTATGEPRFATSIGLSTIYLGRERLKEFSTLKLAKAVLSELLTPAYQEVQRHAQDFVVKHRLLAGQGEHQLLDQLLEEPTEYGSLITPIRVTGLIDGYTQGLKGMDLLIQAEAQAQLAFQQALQPVDDLNTVLNQRQAHLVQAFTVDLQEFVKNYIQPKALTPDDTSSGGLLAAKQFLKHLLELLTHITTEASEDSPRYQDEVSSYQEVLANFQTQTIPYLHQQKEQRPWQYHFFFGRKMAAQIAVQIQEAGWRYISSLKSYYRALMRQAAHYVAIDTLGQLQKPVQLLLVQVQQAENVARDLHAQLHNEVTQVVEYQPKFECPNGLCLINTATDLETYYHRILPEEGAAPAVKSVSSRLLQVKGVLNLLADTYQLRAKLLAYAEATLQYKLAGLHVVSELRHRFSNEKDLGEALRQRNRQSHEFIQLKGNCDTENGVFIIRLLGIDQSQAGDLPKLLNQYSSQRGVSYDVLDTGDPDKIIFLQYRAVFPYSDWAHYPRALDDYRQISQETSFEKFHPVVGSRSLIMPGRYSTPIEANTAIIQSWLLGRIQPHFKAASYIINSAQQRIPLEEAETVFCSREGYQHLVDIISRFSCLYLEQGPQVIWAKLNYLLAVRECQAAPLDLVERAVAPYLKDEVNNLLLEQLEYWQKNTVSAAMEYNFGRLEAMGTG